MASFGAAFKGSYPFSKACFKVPYPFLKAFVRGSYVLFLKAFCKGSSPFFKALFKGFLSFSEGTIGNPILCYYIIGIPIFKDV